MSQEAVDPKAVVAAGDEQAQSAFVARLSSYSLVNSTWLSVVSGYNAVKDYSPLAKAGLEKAEAASQKVYAVAAPVVSQLNDKYKLDEKGVQVLEKGEKTVEGLKVAAADAKNKVVGVAVESKDVATGFVESNPRPFNTLLDVTESLVNKLLPPPLQAPEDAAKAGDAQKSVVARATSLTVDVSNRAAVKLRSISFRSPQEIAEMTHVVDLIQYAAQYIDVDAQKARLQQVVDASKGALEQAKATAGAKIEQAKTTASVTIDNAYAKAQSGKDLVEAKTADLKDLFEAKTSDLKNGAQRTTVAVVASIAHATEVVRRRIGNHVNVSETRAQLQQRLADVIERTKAYTNSLNEDQLKEYIISVRNQSGAALASLINIINSSTSIRASLTNNLLAWTNSVAGRLGYVVVPVAIEDAPFAIEDAPSVADLIEEAPKSSAEPELEKSEKEAEKSAESEEKDAESAKSE